MSSGEERGKAREWGDSIPRRRGANGCFGLNGKSDCAFVFEYLPLSSVVLRFFLAAIINCVVTIIAVLYYVHRSILSSKRINREINDL